jgi:hypothetical protein
LKYKPVSDLSRFRKSSARLTAFGEVEKLALLGLRGGYQIRAAARWLRKAREAFWKALRDARERDRAAEAARG